MTQVTTPTNPAGGQSGTQLSPAARAFLITVFFTLLGAFVAFSFIIDADMDSAEGVEVSRPIELTEGSFVPAMPDDAAADESTDEADADADESNSEDAEEARPMARTCSSNLDTIRDAEEAGAAVSCNLNNTSAADVGGEPRNWALGSLLVGVLVMIGIVSLFRRNAMLVGVACTLWGLALFAGVWVLKVADEPDLFQDAFGRWIFGLIVLIGITGVGYFITSENDILQRVRTVAGNVGNNGGGNRPEMTDDEMDRLADALAARGVGDPHGGTA